MSAPTLQTAPAARLRQLVQPLTGAERDYDALLAQVGDAHYVLLGEASHGTHEFYAERAAITRRLIEEKGFTAVVAEADWPDAYRVNCYVRGASSAADAETALSGFERFPMWMWRNTVARDFVEWLHCYNADLPPDQPRPGFYGMDLYSMGASISAVLRYLDKVDPDAAAAARRRYGCFDHFTDDSQAYGYAATLGMTESCEGQVLAQLRELSRHAAEYAQRDGRVAEDEFFFAEQNARLVKNAEQYYRSMFRGRVSSWNLRDQHMAETVGELSRHLERRDGHRPRLVLWAHNSHLGDARATDMGRRGELNVGQLTRERYGQDAVSIGFTTYTGFVTAATDWDGPAEHKRVRPGLRDSYEELFHQVGLPRFYLPLRGNRAGLDAVRQPRLERAIGVIYRPETERVSHYFEASIGEQFDAVLHFDETRALQPLDRSSHGYDETPETYPFGV